MNHGGMSSRGEDGRKQIMVLEADALVLLASGKREEAIAMLQKAAAAEQVMPFEFGPPPVPKPASELLGDVLLSALRTSDAEKAYRDSLSRAPGRTASARGWEMAKKTAPAPGS